MPVGRFFTGLTVYDLLGNLIPGTFALITISIFPPSPLLPSSVGGYILFAGTAFVLGSVVQAHASKAVGERRSFDRSIAGAESLPNLTQDDDDESENDESRDDELTKQSVSRLDCDGLPGYISNIVYSLFGPLSWFLWSERGQRLDDAILTNRIWSHLVDTHEIPPNTTSYSVLYRLMSSRVDGSESPSRAIRMQAIRNFNRGMWLASWYFTSIVVLLCIVDSVYDSKQSITQNIIYYRPAFFSYWSPTWVLVGAGLAAVVVFWFLSESSEEDYLEYLFGDYAVSIGANATTVEIPEQISVAANLGNHPPDDSSAGDSD